MLFCLRWCFTKTLLGVKKIKEVSIKNCNILKNQLNTLK
jgi:hypothetical protein